MVDGKKIDKEIERTLRKLGVRLSRKEASYPADASSNLGTADSVKGINMKSTSSYLEKLHQ